MSDAEKDPTLAKIDHAIAAVEKESRSRRLSTWMLGLAVAASVAAGLAFKVNDQADARREKQAKVDSDYQACLRGNDTREVSRFLVIAAESSGLDLTQVKGYDALDPAMRQFLANLRDASATNPNSLRERTFPKLAIRDCDAEYPKRS